MKKVLFLFMLISVVFIGKTAVNADTGNERIWYFNEDGFDLNNTTVLTEEETISGLTLGKDVTLSPSKPIIRNVIFYSSIYTGHYGSTASGYIKLYVNGDTDIHFLATTRADDYRTFTMYSQSGGNTQSKSVGNGFDDYVFEYRGAAGYVYFYTPGKNIRIVSIAAKDYSESEYAPLGNNVKNTWDFDAYSNMGIIKTDTNINGMNIKAVEQYPVGIVLDPAKNSCGYEKRGCLDLQGEGRYNSRYITFPVPRNSDIYITARSSDTISQRKLLIRNKYYGIPETDMESEFLNVNGDINTYKISYYGKGEDFAINSYDSAVKIFKIMIVPRVDTVIEDKTWDISSNSALSAGYYANSTIDGLKLRKANIAECNIGGYSKRISVVSDVYSFAGKISFNISDSSLGRGNRVERIITIKANTDLEGTILVVYNSEDYVIGTAELSSDIKEYKFNYKGNYDEITLSTYYPRNEHKAVSYIYSLNNGIKTATGPDDSKRTVSVTKGQKYQYYFTAGNVDADKYTYTIKYNSNALTPKYIGYGDGADSYSKEGINIIKNAEGEITYTIENTNSNWSGVTASVIFEAKSTGNTEIEFMATING